MHSSFSRTTTVTHVTSNAPYHYDTSSHRISPFLNADHNYQLQFCSLHTFVQLLHSRLVTVKGQLCESEYVHHKSTYMEIVYHHAQDTQHQLRNGTAPGYRKNTPQRMILLYTYYTHVLQFLSSKFSHAIIWNCYYPFILLYIIRTIFNYSHLVNIANHLTDSCLSSTQTIQRIGSLHFQSTLAIAPNYVCLFPSVYELLRCLQFFYNF